jgi:hypothetical protein
MSRRDIFTLRETLLKYLFLKIRSFPCYAFAQRDFDEKRIGLMDSTQEFREGKKKEN